MKRTSFGVFAVFGVFLLLVIVASGQIATSEGPSVSSAEPQVGAARGGVSVWHEVTGVGLLNITPEIAKVSETVSYEYSNYTSFNKGVNLTIRFRNNEGYIDTIRVLKDVPKVKILTNTSVEQKFNPANSSFYNVTIVNTSTTTIFEKEWVEIPAVNYVIGSDYYYTARFDIGEQVKLKPKAKVYGSTIKYDAIFHPSASSPTQPIRIEIDPIIDATTAVDDFENSNDINQSATTGGRANGVFVPLNVSVWDTWDDQEYATNPAWLNTTPTSTTGGIVKFAPAGDLGYAFSYSASCQAGGAFSCATFRADNVSVQQNEIGTMISMNIISATASPAAGGALGAGIRINWDAIGATDLNPYSSSSGDSLLCLGGSDSVLYLIQYNDGASTAKANPSFTLSTDMWYNFTLNFNRTHAKCTIGNKDDQITDTGWVAHDLYNLESGKPIFMMQQSSGGAGSYNVSNFSVSNTNSPRTFSNVTLETKVLNSTANIGFVNLSLDFHQKYSSISVPTCQVFDGNHKNTQNVTIGNRTNPVRNTLATSITGIGFNCSFTGINRPDTYFVLNSTILSWEATQQGGGNANEIEGDNAIETAINSSVPSSTKYKTRQVYVVNATDSQQKGTVDYLVVQNSPQRRWLINYITTGEAYLNAQNLSGTVYVLEIADKTTSQITQEVSTFINSTKN